MAKGIHSVALLTGSNHRGKEQILQRAAEHIASRVGEIARASQIHYSEAWGFHSESEFANQALIVETSLEPIEVLEEVLAIEQMLGRDRREEAREREATGERYASRVVDIDVIFYDDYVCESERLTLPHKLMHERDFVLRPLCEVAPDWRHPRLGKSVLEIQNAKFKIQNCE